MPRNCWTNGPALRGRPDAGGYSDPDLTALLTETTAASSAELQARILSISKVLDGFDILPDPSPAKKCASRRIRGIFPVLGIRSGIFPSVTVCAGKEQPASSRTSPSISKTARRHCGPVRPVERHGYSDSCIYGHALEGNFHFIINQAFDSPAEVQRMPT